MLKFFFFTFLLSALESHLSCLVEKKMYKVATFVLRTYYADFTETSIWLTCSHLHTIVRQQNNNSFDHFLPQIRGHGVDGAFIRYFGPEAGWMKAGQPQGQPLEAYTDKQPLVLICIH